VSKTSIADATIGQSLAELKATEIECSFEVELIEERGVYGTTLHGSAVD